LAVEILFWVQGLDFRKPLNRLKRLGNARAQRWRARVPFYDQRSLFRGTTLKKPMIYYWKAVHKRDVQKAVAKLRV